MTSEKQRAANQSNSNRSTGPRSARGKRHASHNAMKLGMYARAVILPGEDKTEYERLRQDVHDET
jgi:hypothetical protein